MIDMLWEIVIHHIDSEGFSSVDNCKNSLGALPRRFTSGDTMLLYQIKHVAIKDR